MINEDLNKAQSLKMTFFEFGIPRNLAIYSIFLLLFGLTMSSILGKNPTLSGVVKIGTEVSCALLIVAAVVIYFSNVKTSFTKNNDSECFVTLKGLVRKIDHERIIGSCAYISMNYVFSVRHRVFLHLKAETDKKILDFTAEVPQKLDSDYEFESSDIWFGTEIRTTESYADFKKLVDFVIPRKGDTSH